MFLYYTVHYKIYIKYRNKKRMGKQFIGRDVLECSSCPHPGHHPTHSYMHSGLETTVPEHQLSLELKRKNANKETRLPSDPS